MKTSSRAPAARRAGYTLIEMLVVITGTVALVGVGTTTLIAVRRVSATAHAAAERGTALSRLHRTLREDAAEARSAIAEGDGLTLTRPDGSTVAYAAADAAVIRTVRDADDGARAGVDRFGVGGTGFLWTAEERPAGVRIGIGFDRAGGPEANADGAAVELAAWLPASGEGDE